ncbi:MAG: CDP-glucose 4,6-dehydratase [Planctomycetota bacterium]
MGSKSFWLGKRVFLTGHTGFKGGWMALWLQSLGAKVYGYALKPPTKPNLFTVASVGRGMAASTIADIRDIKALAKAIKAARPQIVIHMAAQPLVRYSYDQPVETYSTNVMGTANLLECIRHTPSVKAAVIITTDKCYENRELKSGYKETAPLGGYDPYSSSKACAELVTAAYRQSFFGASGHTVGIATARAGNVIGGGDWAPDRLIPDFMRALAQGRALRIRAPKAVRPWQHVLEPLAGYLSLAECLYMDGGAYAEAWNFGPADKDARTVRWIVERLVAATPGATWACEKHPQPHETHYLKLNSNKARARLGWQPRWRLETALDKTRAWHAAYTQGADMHALSLAQIAEYTDGKAAL